jgi:hypothetical protein
LFNNVHIDEQNKELLILMESCGDVEEPAKDKNKNEEQELTMIRVKLNPTDTNLEQTE